MPSLLGNKYVWVCVLLAALAVGYGISRYTSNNASQKTREPSDANERSTSRLVNLKKEKKQLEDDIKKLQEGCLDLKEKIETDPLPQEVNVNVVEQNCVNLQFPSINATQVRDPINIREIAHGVVSLSSPPQDYNQLEGWEEVKRADLSSISTPPVIIEDYKQQWEDISPREVSLLIEKNEGIRISIDTQEDNLRMERKQKLEAEATKLKNQLGEGILRQKRLQQENLTYASRKESLIEDVRKLETRKKELQNHQRDLKEKLKLLRKQGKETLKMRKHSWSSDTPQKKSKENNRFSRTPTEKSLKSGHNRKSGSGTPPLTWAQRVNQIRQTTLRGVSYKRKGLPPEGLQKEHPKAQVDHKVQTPRRRIEVEQLDETVTKRAVSEGVTSPPKSRISVETDNLEDGIVVNVDVPSSENVTVRSLPSPRTDWDFSRPYVI